VLLARRLQVFDVSFLDSSRGIWLFPGALDDHLNEVFFRKAAAGMGDAVPAGWRIKRIALAMGVTPSEAM